MLAKAHYSGKHQLIILILYFEINDSLKFEAGETPRIELNADAQLV
jgi:hypothetical protein